jgi:hypothetical protein
MNPKIKYAFRSAINAERTQSGKRRLFRLRDRLARGRISQTEQVIAMCDLMMGCKGEQ